MKRPSFQFYPADHTSNVNLRRCSFAARGVWVEVMCLLHGSDAYGVIRWPLVEIAQVVGAPLELLHELAQKGVLKGSDGPHDALTYAPYHARRHGPPVTLVAAGDGPCWYSSRMVRDEWVRQRKGEASRFVADGTDTSPKATPDTSPKGGIGERQGDGSSSPTPTPTPSPKLSPPTPRKRGNAERFDEFWLAWPKNERKQDKAKSADYWALHDLDTQADAILADVRTKRGTQKWQDGFIEAPLVYLRGKRWEDGVTPDEPRVPPGRAEPSGRAMVPDAEQSAAEMDAIYGTPPASRAVVDAALAQLTRAKLARSAT